jgi:hypothetical protein
VVKLILIDGKAFDVWFSKLRANCIVLDFAYIHTNYKQCKEFIHVNCNKESSKLNTKVIHENHTAIRYVVLQLYFQYYIYSIYLLALSKIYFEKYIISNFSKSYRN